MDIYDADAARELASRVLAAVDAAATGSPQDGARAAAELGGWNSVLDAAVALAAHVAGRP